MPNSLYDSAVADLPPLPSPAPAPPPSIGGVGPGTRYGSGPALGGPPAAEPANPYDEAVTSLGANDRIQLQSSFAVSADVTPEQAAEARRLAGKTGVPMPQVLKNLKTYQQQDALDQPFGQIQQETPHLAGWLAADPHNAAVAKDDLANLGALEWLVTMPSRAVAQTINQQRYGAIRSASIYRDLTREEQDQLDSYKFQMQRDGGLGVGDSWFKGALTKGIQLAATLTLPQTAATAALGAVGAVAGGAIGTAVEPGGGTLVGAVQGARMLAPLGYTYGLAKSAFQTESGTAYDQYLDVKDEYGRALDPNVAKMAALATGVINAGLMVGGGQVIAHSLGVGVEKLTGSVTRNAVTQALKNPTVRVALADAMKGYAATLAEGTGLMVGMAGVRILSGELAKAAGKTILAPGQLEAGNVNLFQQPTVKNADGSISTVDSLSVNLDGREVLLPTVTADGRHFAGTPVEKTQQAVAEYQKTGRQLGTFSTPEAANAFAEQLHQDYAAGKYAGVNKYRAPGDLLSELTTAAADAIQGFALVGAVGPALGLAGDLRRATTAKQNVALFTALGDGVTNSKTLQRAPDAVRDFLAKATKDGPVETVYAPVESFVQYWQSKEIDPVKMATELTGKPDALEVAQRTGEDLAIPTADYATKLAGTEHHKFFANELRLAPEQMNGKEATKFLADLEKSRAAAAAAPPAEAGTSATSAQIRSALVDRLMQGGQMERSTAETNAAVVGEFFDKFVGERAGLDPQALFDARVGAIQRAEAPPEATFAFYEGADANPVPKYFIQTDTGPTQVTAERLTELGIPIPETPADTGVRLNGDQLRAIALAKATEAGPLYQSEVAALLAQPETLRKLDRRQTQTDMPLAGMADRRASTPSREAAVAALSNPDAPINVMDNIGAAALQMVKEDPTLRTRARAMQKAAQSFGQPLFHGSPHDFDVFSSKFIGSGEGAQAYGHGLYFAENPDVAKDYQKDLARPGAVLVDGKPWREAKLTKTQRDVLAAIEKENVYINSEDALRTIGDVYRQSHTSDKSWASWTKAWHDLSTRMEQTAPESKLYQVDIPDEHIAKMLDWDKPLSEQPEFVRAALASLGVEQKTTKSGSRFAVDPTGEQIYKTLANERSMPAGGALPKWMHGTPLASDKAASEALATAGIPGLRYLDQGSRNNPALIPAQLKAAREGLAASQGSGTYAATQRERFQQEIAALEAAPVEQTRNVVVFDDSIVTLTHKDGTPVTANERKEFFQSQTPPSLNQERRASVSFDPTGKATIALFAKADLSSFQHEWAHVSLELIGDVVDQLKALDPATLTEGQAKILDDYKTVLLPFLGVDSRDQIGRAQHERFANAWEDYLMEGKAPSAELRPVFARMRAWLVSVYRLVSRRVTLTPEVRSFMDRLVASDTAIEQAQADGHLTPLFTDATSAGMSAPAFEAYRETVQAASDRAKDDLQQELIREQQRAQQAWWKEEEAKTRAAVAADIYQTPTARALAVIQKGTRPDGTPLTEGQAPSPLKLAKADLVDRYTPAELAVLRRRQLYSADGGTSPEALADLTGFSSGDELVRALLKAPSTKATIEAETQARMLAAHGDLRLDGRLADHAQASVFGEHRQNVVEAELKALTTGMVKGTIPPASVLRAVAESRIGGMKVRDVTPGQFLMAAQRASAKAFDLLSTNADRVGAVQAKQQELMNLALYREARDAQARVTKQVDYLRSFDKTTTRERIGKAGGDYLEQIDGLRERFDLTRLTLKQVDRRTALAQWAASKAESTGLPLDLPAALLNEARRTHYKDLTIDELHGLRDGVRMIEHLAQLKNKLLRAGEKRDLDALGAEGAASIEKNTRQPRVEQLGPRRPGEAGKRTRQGWLIAHRPMLAILRQMDGFQDGFLFEHIWRPAHEARNAEVTLSQAAAARWAEIHQTRFAGEEASLHQETYIPALGNSLTTAERIVVALNSGNAGNRERLTAAGIGNSGPLSEPVQQAILNTLTARDWTYVRDMAELMSSHRADIGALSKRVTGVEPTWVDPAPFHTPHGEQPGWYYPIVYEGRSSARALPGPEASFADIVGKSAYLHFMTNDGHVEQRVAHTGIPLRADLGVIGEHLQQVVHDLTHREMLIDVGRILGRKDIQEAIYRNYGDQYYQEIQGAFRDVAIGPMPAPGWYRTVMSLRRGATLARLAWNFATMVRHVTNITNGMVRVGAGDVAAAIPAWIGSAKDAENSVGWITTNSSFMGSRWNHRMEDLVTASKDIGLNRGKVASELRDAATRVGVDPDLVHRFADSYLYGIHKIIQMAEIPSWLAAYRKARGQERTHADSIASADNAVLDAFGGGDTLDLAGIQRSTQGKLFTTFMTFSLTLHRQNFEILSKDASVGRKVLDASLLNLVPVLFLGGLFHQVHKKDTLAHELAAEVFAHITGMFVGVRELSGAMTYRDYQGPAALSPIGTATRAIYDSAQTLRADTGEKALTKATTAAKEVAELGSQYYGVPVYQVEKTAAGIQALWDKKTSDLSVLLFGPPPKGTH